MAGGGGLDVRPSEVKLPAAQAGAGHACDAPRDTGRSQGRLARTGPLGTAEHGFYRASESDRPSWGGSADTSHLGNGPASPTTPGPPGMVASVLSLCASPRIAAGSARAAARTRWQASGATLPTAYPSYGNGENQPNVDSTGSALLSFAAGAMRKNLSVNEARRRAAKRQWAHQ